MASPFKLFRKYQKSAFVILGVMAMVSFIVLPAILQYMGGSGTVDVTFATSRFGKIDAMQLNRITTETSNLAQFYEQLAREIIIKDQMRCVPLENAAYMLRNVTEEQAVEQWLIARYMREEGFTVSREDVGAYLSQMTFNPTAQKSYATEETFREAVKALSGFNDEYVTYLVSNQMLLEQFYNMSIMNVRALTPETEFDWYNRFNRMMKIEAIPVAVGDFTAQVSEPSQKELKKFFEDNKFRDRNPRALESGFAIPMMVKGEYVSFDKSMLKSDEVTDAEIEKYYEDNKKDLYVERPMTTTPGMTGIPNPGGIGTLTVPGATDETTTPSGDTTTTPIVEPSPEAAPTTPEQTETPANEPAPATEEKPAPANEESTTPPAETSSLFNHNLPIRLVSYQSEDAEAQNDAAPAAENKTDDATTTPVETQPGAQTEPATETPVITLPPGGGIGGSALGGRTGLGSGLGGTTSPFGRTVLPNLGGGATSPALTGVPQPQMPVTYRPLDDTLKAEIREIIAREKMNDKLKQVQETMSEYRRQYIKELQQKKAKTPLPDLAAQAKNLGLKYVDLGRLDYFDLIDKHYDFAASAISANNTSYQVAQAMFLDRGVVNENREYRSSDRRDGTEYLFWVTEITEPKIPTYDTPGIAEQVEARWRQVEARSLARAKADELAKSVKQADGSLIEYFSANPNKEVKTVVGTEFFTWMDFNNPYYYQYMNRPPDIFLGEVRESGVLPNEAERNNVVLRDIGEEFMQTVYNMTPGEIAVAHNRPENTFYVVRLAEVTPTDDEAFESYTMTSPDNKAIYNMAAVQDRLVKARQGAVKQVFEKTKFAWKVKPSEYQQQERLKSQQRQADNKSPNDSRGNVPPNVPRF